MITKRPIEKLSEVDEFMKELHHPLKPEIEEIRKIVRKMSRYITESIKWGSLTFSYKGIMAAFDFHKTDKVHLVFHAGAMLRDRTGLLKGDYTDRRIAHFSDLKDVKAKKSALKGVVGEWIVLMDRRR